MVKSIKNKLKNFSYKCKENNLYRSLNMIVLNKKRLVIITSCLLISIFAFMLSSSKKNDVIETVSLPVSGKTIVLDARTWNSR